MLLAGGSGIRLLPLTRDIPKPVVSYGGKYKIIDFALSNLYNSQINTVGILIQNNQIKIENYLDNGSTWGFNDRFHLLKPIHFYRGTANAVYQNANFIKYYNPEDVLIISGDHIYDMDYQPLISFHKRTNADCTIAVKNVSLSDASRFGIMTIDHAHRIIKFTEKPKYPDSTLASMGIYLFKTNVLLHYLEEDENDKSSDNDFGKNIIPKMVQQGVNLYAYTFNGYWKDVGTLNSLWEANMSLLNKELNINHINTKEKEKCLYINNQKIRNSLIMKGCFIEGEVYNSILSKNVIVKKGAIINNSIIMENSMINRNVIIDYAIIGENVVVDKNIIIGSKNALTVIGDDILVSRHIQAGMVIAKN